MVNKLAFLDAWVSNNPLNLQTSVFRVVTDKESAIYIHLRSCENLAFIHKLINLPYTLNNITTPTISGNNEYAINVVQNNTTVLDYDDSWNLLLYKEAFHIKRQSPSLKGQMQRNLDNFSFVEKPL